MSEEIKIDKTKPIFFTTTYEDGSKITCVYSSLLYGDIDVILENYKNGNYDKNVKISN
jgi:hypothetical protein